MRGKCATSSMRAGEGMNPVGGIDRFCCDDEPLRKVRPNVGESAFSQTQRTQKDSFSWCATEFSQALTFLF